MFARKLSSLGIKPVTRRHAGREMRRACRAAFPSRRAQTAGRTGCRQLTLLAIGQLRHLVQTAAADDANADVVMCEVCVGSSRELLRKLHEHAVRTRRVDERDQRPVRTGPRRLVDQPHAAGLEHRQRGADVVHPKRDVVQAGAALPEEFRDRRIVGGRLEQLERGVPGGTK